MAVFCRLFFGFSQQIAQLGPLGNVAFNLHLTIDEQLVRGDRTGSHVEQVVQAGSNADISAFIVVWLHFQIALIDLQIEGAFTRTDDPDLSDDTEVIRLFCQILIADQFQIIIDDLQRIIGILEVTLGSCWEEAMSEYILM